MSVPLSDIECRGPCHERRGTVNTHGAVYNAPHKKQGGLRWFRWQAEVFLSTKKVACAFFV
jgi:hypothetical protein